MISIHKCSLKIPLQFCNISHINTNRQLFRRDAIKNTYDHFNAFTIIDFLYCFVIHDSVK